jgi:hypothetical protein
VTVRGTEGGGTDALLIPGTTLPTVEQHSLISGQELIKNPGRLPTPSPFTLGLALESYLTHRQKPRHPQSQHHYSSEHGARGLCSLLALLNSPSSCHLYSAHEEMKAQGGQGTLRGHTDKGRI